MVVWMSVVQTSRRHWLSTQQVLATCKRAQMKDAYDFDALIDNGIMHMCDTQWCDGFRATCKHSQSLIAISAVLFGL